MMDRPTLDQVDNYLYDLIHKVESILEDVANLWSRIEKIEKYLKDLDRWKKFD